MFGRAATISCAIQAKVAIMDPRAFFMLVAGVDGSVASVLLPAYAILLPCEGTADALDTYGAAGTPAAL